MDTFGTWCCWLEFIWQGCGGTSDKKGHKSLLQHGAGEKPNKGSLKHHNRFFSGPSLKPSSSVLKVYSSWCSCHHKSYQLCVQIPCPSTHNTYMLYTLSLPSPAHMQTHTHSHERCLGLQHAGRHGNVLVVEGHHVEADGLGHGQHHGQQPDHYDLYRRNRGNTCALHSWPRCHCTIPECKSVVFSLFY